MYLTELGRLLPCNWLPQQRDVTCFLEAHWLSCVSVRVDKRLHDKDLSGIQNLTNVLHAFLLCFTKSISSKSDGLRMWYIYLTIIISSNEVSEASETWLKSFSVSTRLTSTRKRILWFYNHSIYTITKCLSVNETLQ